MWWQTAIPQANLLVPGRTEGHRCSVVRYGILAIAAALNVAAVTTASGAETLLRDALPSAPTRFTNDGAVFGPTRVHQIEVTISPSEWEVLQRETYVNRGGVPLATEDDIKRPDGRIVHIGGGFGGTFPWVHGDVRVNGALIRDAGIRYKGNGSYNAAAGLHRNLKIKTDFFGGTDDWASLETLNFNSGGRDASRMRETLTFAIFRAAGVPVSRTAYVEIRFTVPGIHDKAYGGLFTVIENVNKKFLKHALPPGTGLLMKPERMQQGGVGYYGETWADYVPSYRPQRDATPEEARRVIDFARLVNNGGVEEFRARIDSFLDVDEFLRFIAVNAIVMSRDSYLSGRHNYFIYLDPKDNRFRFIPWDEDGALAGGNGGTANTDLLRPYSTDNPLIYWLLDDPSVAARYKKIVKEIMTTVLARPDFQKLIGSLESLVAEPIAKEVNAMSSRGERNNYGSGNPPRFFFQSRTVSVEQQMGLWFQSTDSP